MDIQFDEKSPIYLQIIRSIKKEIIAGKLKPGDKLPSVRELAVMTKVNPNTIQRVYQELEREGVSFTQRGMGSFVTEETASIARMRLEMSQDLIKEFVREMNSLGLKHNEMLDLLQAYLEGEAL